MKPSELSRVCPGLPADWINAWLAAVGATVLVPGLRLSWTMDALPTARLEHPDIAPDVELISRWPSRERLDSMPVARDHPDCRLAITRRVSVDAFHERIRATTQNDDAWTLTSTITDLEVDRGRALQGPLDPPAPRGICLHDRLLSTHREVIHPEDQIPKTLAGMGVFADVNGLGFDIARLGEGKLYVDPVVETLAFFGLALFPVRGDGVRRRYPRSRQRGWHVGGFDSLIWPAWEQPLDRYGIDALLDAWHGSWRRARTRNSMAYEWKADRSMWELLKVHSAWRSTRYVSATRETNRGYGSMPLSAR